MSERFCLVVPDDGLELGDDGWWRLELTREQLADFYALIGAALAAMEPVTVTVRGQG